MADGKHQNPVPPAVVPVQGDISRFAARYHELAEIGLGGSANQGMPLEYRGRVEGMRSIVCDAARGLVSARKSQSLS